MIHVNRLRHYLGTTPPATSRTTRLDGGNRAAADFSPPAAPPETWLQWLRRKVGEIAGDWRADFAALPTYEDCLSDVHVCWDCGNLRERCKCVPGEG